MRVPALIVAVAGWALLAPMASAQQAVIEEPSAGMKSCIATNAPGVERAVEDLSEATAFLVKKVCIAALADQIIDINKRQIAEQKAHTDAMCKDILAKPKPAPKPQSAFPSFDLSDDDYLREMCEKPKQEDFWASAPTDPDALFFWDINVTDVPRAEALAAQTLLKLRVERLNRKP